MSGVNNNSLVALSATDRPGDMARVFEYISAHPGCTQLDVSRDLSIPRQTVSGRISDLKNISAIRVIDNVARKSGDRTLPFEAYQAASETLPAGRVRPSRKSRKTLERDSKIKSKLVDAITAAVGNVEGKLYTGLEVQEILNGLLNCDEDNSCIVNPIKIPAFVSNIVDAIHNTPHCGQLKLEMARILLKHYPRLPLMSYMKGAENDNTASSRDWG